MTSDLPATKSWRPLAALGVLRASAATTALFLAGMLLPFGGTIVMVFTPQPGFGLERRAGMGPLVTLVALVAAIAASVAGWQAAVLYLAGFAVLTIALPLLLRRELSIEATVGLATLFVAAALTVSVFSTSSPEEILGGLRGALDQAQGELIAVYERAGLGPDAVRDLRQGSTQILDVAILLAPALGVLSIGAIVLANLALVRRRERLAGLPPRFGDLTRWKCPSGLVWVLIASGYGLFVPWRELEIVSANVFALVLSVYFCQGMAVAHFYTRRWRSPIWMTALIYIFVFIEWLLATGMVLVGIFDMWADFRRLNPRPIHEED